MTLPDFADWSQGVNVVERVSDDLLNPATITANGAPVLIDTSRYNALSLLPVVPNVVQGNRYGLFAQWQNNGQPMAAQTLTFHDLFGNGSFIPGVLFWHIPVRGPQLQLWAVGDANTVIPLHVYGSTRELPAPEVSPPSSGNGRQLLDTGLISIPAGGNGATWYIRPVARTISVRIGASVNSTPLAWTLTGVACGAASISASNILSGTATGSTMWPGLEMPDTGMEIFASNNDTVARNLRIAVWDVS